MPRDSATSTACSVPVASSTWSASSTNSPTAYAAASWGWSERPLPRGSKVITRLCRARWGTCSFQIRDGTIDQVGSSSTAGSPAPEGLVADPHAVALDVPLLVRFPGPHAAPSVADVPATGPVAAALQPACKRRRAACAHQHPPGMHLRRETHMTTIEENDRDDRGARHRHGHADGVRRQVRRRPRRHHGRRQRAARRAARPLPRARRSSPATPARSRPRPAPTRGTSTSGCAARPRAATSSTTPPRRRTHDARAGLRADRPDGPVFLPGAFELALGALKAQHHIEESFRTGAGLRLARSTTRTSSPAASGSSGPAT